MTARTTTLLRKLDDGARSGRWTAPRKAAVLELLDREAITYHRLDVRYGIQPHEVEEWRHRAERFGLLGLFAGMIQETPR